MKKKLKIGVVFGGPSSEHDVSVNSGKNIFQNLDKNKYTPVAIKISKTGNWLIPFIQKVKKVDVVFLALHGKFGEDGKIQAILDTLKIPYTGSGVQASSIAMDKTATSRILSDLKLNTPKTQLIKSEKEQIDIKLPFVVKPNSSGSSVGISIVKSKKEISKALRIAFKEDREVLIEEYIRGTELTCGVLGNTERSVIALPVAEVRVVGVFLIIKQSIMINAHKKFALLQFQKC